ncbi:hypothetical protein L596_017011 [Steinernema carpocapsae]|uniref:Uncharacterized protein n=1 Tax=Steinernema carpocapsae TaxID=34508 RepID=A0A4U5N0I4_STECR|nr:hypothetical protein L596_017011 [Steinernema carpocapsae]
MSPQWAVDRGRSGILAVEVAETAPGIVVSVREDHAREAVLDQVQHSVELVRQSNPFEALSAHPSVAFRSFSSQHDENGSFGLVELVIGPITLLVGLFDASVEVVQRLGEPLVRKLGGVVGGRRRNEAVPRATVDQPSLAVEAGGSLVERGRQRAA